MKSIKTILTSKTVTSRENYRIDNQDIVEQAQRIINRCIECRKCTKECALIEYYGPTPKSLFEPFASAKLIEADIPYACHDCGRCEKVCPHQLPMGQVLMSVRHEYVKQNGGKSPVNGHGGVRMHQRLSFSSLFSYKKQVNQNEY